MGKPVISDLTAHGPGPAGGWCYWNGAWTSTPPKLTGPAEQAFWLSGVVFDGARSFGGLAPDLDRHCARVVASARAMLLKPTLDAAAILDLCKTGIAKFPRAAELYIRPMFFATGGFIVPDAETTEFVLYIYESPMPSAKGFSATLSSLRRPARDMAPTDAKASCHYPNSARALAEAEAKGFDNAILLDPAGNVAEFAGSNLFMAKDGVCLTPAANGTFLNGITRQRVIQLLRDAGVAVEERAVTYKEVLAADEIFSTGNYAKVTPLTRIEDRHLQPGPIYAKARALYFKFAESARVV